MSVRELLGQYGKARHGKHVQSRIEDLEQLGLRTVPDSREAPTGNLEKVVGNRLRCHEKRDAGDRGEVRVVNALEDGKWRLIYNRDQDGKCGATQPLDEHPGVQAGDRVLVYHDSTPKLRVQKVLT